MRILLATDGSKHALSAAHFLRNLQFKPPVSLSIFTASYQLEMQYHTSMTGWYEDWHQSEAERVIAHQLEMKELLEPTGWVIDRKHRNGNATSEILKYADEIAADLIVIGAKGHSAISRLVLGSVSDSVATQAKCSVLVVRNEHPDTHQFVQQPIRCQLAYDQSTSAKAAAAELTCCDWTTDSELNVLSIVREIQYFAQEHLVQYQGFLHEELDHARLGGERLVSALSQFNPHVGSQVVRGAHVGEAIVQIADECDSNLIVLGSNGRGLLERIAMGSTSNYVLRHAKQSVWISRMNQSWEDTLPGLVEHEVPVQG